MKPPFRVLYSNDATHILTCKSPYSPQGTFARRVPAGAPPGSPATEWIYDSPPFTKAMLEASVDETAGMGIDVHMLQPGVGWVPWWKSNVYPYEEHMRFVKQHTGMDPTADGFATYMAAGGDMVDVFVRRCRLRGMAPFVSFRLNDSHGHEFTAMPPDQIPSWAWHVFSPTHVEHPEWRLGPDIRDWNSRVLNWAVPEVPAAKLAFIREILEGYDVDGFELDFMRHCRFFREDETTLDQRVAIMTEFVREVRSALDRTARAGGRRWLCVRIPAQTACHGDLGLDLPALIAAGVDMVNLSNYYFTEQMSDVALVRQAVGDQAAVYLEMCHCTCQRDPEVIVRREGDYTVQRRTTPYQYATTAHLAYARGADGVSTFNFVYFREHGIGERGPGSEPPFAVHHLLGDPARLARQPQHYFLAAGWNRMGKVPRVMNRTIRPGQTAEFVFDMAPPATGWRKDGKLRIQALADLGESKWSVYWNGVALAETGDRSEPYANPYPQLLGTPAQHRAWHVPSALPQGGSNTIALSMTEGGGTITLTFLDVAIE